jgi:aminoglycoside 6-adenylyltransferase
MNITRDMAKEVVDWAIEDDNIRAVILTSTRTNPNAAVDVLSDYDIELVVRDRGQLSDPDEWMTRFGRIMVRHPIWTMVLYLDAPRIDFAIMTVEELEKEVNAPVLAESYDIGYEVLLDKDGLTKGLKKPTYTAYRTKPPTESEYKELVHRFWFNITYVAKGLYRDELFFAKNTLDGSLHHTSLKTALAWYLGMKSNWTTNPGVSGKWFKKQLDPQMWSEVEETFAGANVEENWKAMFKIAELFERLTSEVGAHLGYAYPTEVDRNVIQYLKKIRTMSEKQL